MPVVKGHHNELLGVLDIFRITIFMNVQTATIWVLTETLVTWPCSASFLFHQHRISKKQDFQSSSYNIHS